MKEKRRQQAPTFREAARRTFEAYRPTWRSGKHTKNWLGSLEKHVFPLIGDRPVNEIDTTDVVEVLEPIWAKIPETARRVRQRMSMTFEWCYSKGYIELNPADKRIKGALPTMPAVKEHFRALPYQEVPSAITTIWNSNASNSAKLCLVFLILTAVRSIEAREASWSEIDEDSWTWRIPASRMKAKANHNVPLSRQAKELLKQAKFLRDESNLIFPSPLRPGKALSDMTLTKILRTTGLADRSTVHGFRSSFRDFSSECTDAPFEIKEMSLAHQVGDAVTRAYARSDLLKRRHELMQQWADYVLPPGAIWD